MPDLSGLGVKMGGGFLMLALSIFVFLTLLLASITIELRYRNPHYRMLSFVVLIFFPLLVVIYHYHHLGLFATTKWMVPFGIGSMALISTDRISGDEIAEFDRGVKASRIISYGGSTYSGGAIAATFYLVGRTKHDARARETGLLGAESMIDSLFVVQGLKEITQRARPLAGRERSEFFDGGNSFPSGHSTQAWSLATIVAKEYGDHPLVQVAAYGAATAVSVSRFTGQKHYLSDVVVGSALGYGIGQYVYRARHRTPTDSSVQDQLQTNTRWPTIAPQYSRRAHQYGVALGWSF